MKARAPAGKSVIENMVYGGTEIPPTPKKKYAVLKRVSKVGTYYIRVCDGHFHRDDGPAILYNDGLRGWYQAGKLHRTDGPALERIDNDFAEWYIEGEKLTFQHWLEWCELDDEQKIFLKLKYG